MSGNSGSNRNLIFGFVLAYAVVFAALSMVGYYCMPSSGEKIRISKIEAPVIVSDYAYVDLPPVIVSVEPKATAAPAPRVRVDLALEVNSKDRAVVEGYQPYITERVGSMLRTLSSEDIQSADNISWIRSEMLRAVNNSGAPATVHAVIFRRMVVM